MSKKIIEKNVIVIIQARTDSSRLPGKALLPIGGIESAILAAKRAGNRGHEVLLATSTREIDDLLVRRAIAAGVSVYRGEADDVRARFLGATSALSDDTVLIRLTADNMLPDGQLIEDFVQIFSCANTDYLGVGSVWNAPPYGLSIELMNLGALRSVALEANDPYDCEHVTPNLRQKNPPLRSPAKFFSEKESAVRCTIDVLDDYLRVSEVFRSVEDPVNVGWKELLKNFIDLPDASPGISFGPRLVLGTAQLAMLYGSVTKVNPPSRLGAIKLIRRGINLGAIAIDTAQAYTGSEKRIGEALEGGWESRAVIVTKLKPLPDMDSETLDGNIAMTVENAVLQSLINLKIDKIPYLLLHQASDLKRFDGQIWSGLLKLRQSGLIKELGVSVQNPQEFFLAVANPDIKMIQMPFNLIDTRWHNLSIEEILLTRPDIKVFTRSIYLQGVLLRPAKSWPKFSGFDPQIIIDKLRYLVVRLRRKNVADLCLAWVRAHNWIAGAVVGMESTEQLEENAILFSREPLTMAEVAIVQEVISEVPENLCNPALWNN
jgi:spore coat polysaccharide biosynthesis protein SpsF (cytidylyltransferase family)/aryl-alcohol dehydrogenase-like predicted oxidoreductase